ncbi:hypothetical protein [Nocardia camponoti]|uniref:Uncharacterized protein n=1 Tax=Nocardia camponoti TaxID=1616106 RepID=A0A917QME7_9NOCA|nr:hypothetical protein [Nocardia camponoti]GGK57935.1 hypothetical protein GCM10011591_32630 [Nocardia camponoti]
MSSEHSYDREKFLPERPLLSDSETFDLGGPLTRDEVRAIIAQRHTTEAVRQPEGRRG